MDDTRKILNAYGSLGSNINLEFDTYLTEFIVKDDLKNYKTLTLEELIKYYDELKGQSKTYGEMKSLQLIELVNVLVEIKSHINKLVQKATWKNLSMESEFRSEFDKELELMDQLKDSFLSPYIK